MSFPRYPKYKASGVEWLGDVPEGWVICAPKRRIKSAAGGTLIKGTCSDEPSDGLFPGFSASGQNVWLEEYNYDCPAIVLSAVGARCGKAFKADGKWGVVANTHCLFPLRDSDRDYLWYLTNQEDWWEKGGSAQPFVKVSETLARPWVFPPLPEQTAIAEFLDRETGKIDELVAEQRRLMELLKEKRQAVISHAVTKGLNPHAPMKPSCIEWLGDVPVGWKVFPLNRLVQAGRRITYGIVQPGPRDESGRFMVRGQDYSFGWAEPETLFRVSDEVEMPYRRARLIEGDLVITIVGAGIGNVAVVPPWLDGANITQTTARISVDPAKADPRFVAAVLKGPIGRRSVELYAKGAAQPGLNLEHVRIFPITVPPLSEQREIADYIEAETSKFDTLTAEAQRTIDLLQERRTALISAAVTGQIDVRQQPRN
jgi:type I restriction enzyme S subunit